MRTCQATAGEKAPTSLPVGGGSTHVLPPRLPLSPARLRKDSYTSLVSVTRRFSLVVVLVLGSIQSVCLAGEGDHGAFSDEAARQKALELVMAGPHYTHRVNKLYQIAKRMDLSKLTLKLGNMDLVAEHSKSLGGKSPLMSPINAAFSKVSALAKAAEAQAMADISHENAQAAKQFKGVDVSAELSSLLMSRLSEIRVESTGSVATSALKRVQTFYLHLTKNRDAAFNNFIKLVRTADPFSFDRLLKTPPERRVEHSLKIARREAQRRVEEAAGKMDKAKWIELLYAGLNHEFLVDVVMHRILNPRAVQVSDSSKLEEVRAIVAEARERLTSEANEQGETVKHVQAEPEKTLVLPKAPLVGPKLIGAAAVILVATGLAFHFWRRRKENKRRTALRKSREESDRDLDVDFNELLTVPLDRKGAKGEGTTGIGGRRASTKSWRSRLRSRDARKKYALREQDDAQDKESKLWTIPEEDEEEEVVVASRSSSRSRH